MQELTAAQGFRHGLGLRHSMVDDPTFRDQRSWPDHQLLAHIQHWHLDCGLLSRSVHHSDLWRSWVWRR